jgi:hypothetical protein
MSKLLFSGIRSSSLRAAGPEHVFEAAMKAFHQTVVLRVVSYCLGVLDVKQVAQGGPQGGGKM